VDQRRHMSFAGGHQGTRQAEVQDSGPKVACPFCDYLIPLRWAIGPDGRRPLTCPRCERPVSLPGEPD
jgi:hypothetical protein